MPDIQWLSELGLSPQEQDILAALTSQQESIDGVTESLADEQLWEALNCSFRVYATVRRAQEHLKPIIGKLLIALEDCPDVYKSRGYSTYDDFITRGLPELFGIPRSQAYRSKRMVAAWPNLSPAEYAEIGEAKLYDLSRFTSSADPRAEHWLGKARSLTHDQLRDEIARAGEVPKEIMIPAQIVIDTSLDIKLAWTEFANHPAVVAVVGSHHHGAILLAMIAESSSSWLGPTESVDDQPEEENRDLIRLRD